MSEPTPVRGIVLGHGQLAAGLVDAVRQITGVEEGSLVAISNRGLSPDALLDRIQKVAGDGPLILFVDLQSGSCGFAARRLCDARPRSAVVFGVNLPQLLDFVTHRELPLNEIVQRVLERGRSGICCTPARLEEEHVDRSVSGG